MPALGSLSLLDNLTARDIVPPPTGGNATGGNTSGGNFQVICAWPVSGQYGPGSRFIYYFLVAACVALHRVQWLRNACLAAALLFPAVAAIHGIVLASLHIESAIDMDIYGAFQMCSIGILAAPVTVRLSNTYWLTSGRNLIFLWTGLVLAGLLSITVEFFRYRTSDCVYNPSQYPQYPQPMTADAFPYTDDTFNCGLICTEDDGPKSPMRTGSADNIYVIPAPHKLPFGTATLLSAACCIPAILSMVFMAFKILETQWKLRFGDDPDEPTGEQVIGGTNGATANQMRSIDRWIRTLLSVIEVPIFSAAVLFILVVGERNFFSQPVKYQNEPIAAVGQWAPIAGTLFAALGSLYVLLAAEVEAVEKGDDPDASTCDHPNDGRTPTPHGRQRARSSQSTRDQFATQPGMADIAIQESHATSPIPSMQEAYRMRTSSSSENVVTRASTLPNELQPSGTPPSPRSMVHRDSEPDVGYRRKLAKTLYRVGRNFGAPSYDMFDDSEFRRGRAQDYPEIPGERQRNTELSRIRESYNPPRDAEGNVTPGAQEQQRFRSLTVPGATLTRQQSERSLSPYRLPTTP